MTTQNPTAPASIVVNFADFGDLLATKKQFSTGSVGYYGNGKVVIDEQVYQVGVTLTLVGSKPV
jgi:hypothetical protein